MSDNNEFIGAEVGGSYTMPPAGNQLAVCIGLYILGTLESTYEGHTKKDKKVMLAFELVSTNHVFKQENGQEPFVMYKEFTHSLNAKANLRKFINNWTGGKMTDEQAAKLNLSNVVGVAGFANVVHDKNKKGDDRADILGLTPIMPGIQVPAIRKPKRIFNVNKVPFPTAEFQALPEWIRKKIEKSDEYVKLNGGTVNMQAQQQVVQDDNPFANAQNGGTNTIDNTNVGKIF